MISTLSLCTTENALKNKKTETYMDLYGLIRTYMDFFTTPLYDRGVCYYVPSHGTRSHNLISMMKHNDQLK